MPSRPDEALGAHVLRRYLSVRPGERVTVESWSHALGWARGIVVEARRMGAEAALVVEDEEAFFRSVTLPGTPPYPGASPAWARASDAYVYLPGPEGYHRLLGLTPADRTALLDRHGERWWREARRARLRAVRLAIATVTPEAAARYRADLTAWQEEMLSATLVPPERLARRGAAVLRRLARARRLSVRHPNGTDLELRLAPGSRAVEDGRPHGPNRRSRREWTTLPTGRVSAGIVARSPEGTWESNRPTYDRSTDPPVSYGARFRFHEGRLAEFAFSRGGRAFAATFGPRRPRPTIVRAVTFGLNPSAGRAPEIGDLGTGVIGLVIARGPRAAGVREAPSIFRTTLAGADVDVDGTPWWIDGRPVDRTVRRRPPRR